MVFNWHIYITITISAYKVIIKIAKWYVMLHIKVTILDILK